MAADDPMMSDEMRALPRRMRAFVEAWLTIGARNHKGEPNYTACAEKAGYSTNSESSLRVQGYRLAHDKRIQAAILEETKRRVRSVGSLAFEECMKIVQSPTSKDSDKLKAIQMVMDRAGLHTVAEQKITVEHLGQDKDRVAKIAQMARELGMDPVQVLGKRLAAPTEEPLEAIDAEFEETPVKVDLEGII